MTILGSDSLQAMRHPIYVAGCPGADTTLEKGSGGGGCSKEGASHPISSRQPGVRLVEHVPGAERHSDDRVPPRTSENSPSTHFGEIALPKRRSRICRASRYHRALLVGCSLLTLRFLVRLTQSPDPSCMPPAAFPRRRYLHKQRICGRPPAGCAANIILFEISWPRRISTSSC